MHVVAIEQEEFAEFTESIVIPLNRCAIGTVEESPQVRKEKIFTVRRQLAEGTYDLDGRLDALLDRLLTALHT